MHAELPILITKKLKSKAFPFLKKPKVPFLEGNKLTAVDRFNILEKFS